MRKNILQKITFITISVLSLLIILSITSNAASISISVSKSTVSPGETFTVTVSANGGAGSVTTSVSNGSGGKTDFLDNNSYSFTCTAGNSGTVSISAAGTLGDYSTEEDEYRTASRSVTISTPSSNNTTSSGTGNVNTNKNQTPTVTNQPQKSSDSTLKGLTVEEGTISLEFNKNTREYTLSVPNAVTKLNLSAEVNNNKATYSIKGNEELQVGENIVTITVKAEDGSSSNYIIKVTRAREELLLTKLTVQYINENGEAIILPLTPVFEANIYEYDLEEIEHTVSKLLIESIANLENATIEINGNDELKEGENIITIVVKVPKEISEGEEPADEIKTYTLKVNKKPVPIPPTLMGRISNWFDETKANTKVWFNENLGKIITISLYISLLALGGIIIYMSIDYGKYKILIEKLQKLTELNQAKENITTSTNDNILESISKPEEQNQDDSKTVKKTGRHF